MIDGTPVLDIKPFIQAYDNPRNKLVEYLIISFFKYFIASV